MVSCLLYSVIFQKGYRSIASLAKVLGKPRVTIHKTLNGERFGIETRELIERELEINLNDYVPIPPGHRHRSRNNGSHAEASAKAGSQPGMKSE